MIPPSNDVQRSTVGTATPLIGSYGPPSMFSSVRLSAEAIVNSDSRNEAVALYVDQNARNVVAISPACTEDRRRSSGNQSNSSSRPPPLH